MKAILKKLVARPTQEKEAISPLQEEAEKARRDWLSALQELNHLTDADMLEHVIYKIISNERRFMALLKQARREGLAAWTELPDTQQPQGQEEAVS